jgi:hypothetical protein
MILKHACEHGMISIIKHIMNNYSDLVGGSISQAIDFTNTSSYIDDNKREEILDLLSKRY